MTDEAKQLKSVLDSISQQIADELEKEIKVQMRLMGLERSGDLLKSIEQKKNADGSIEVGSTSPYAEIIHQGFGRGLRMPKPFMLNAAKSVTRKYDGTVEA